ncbi:hypothetical protein [Thaumasiovibrio subtropicus]|uniref:HD domain-containing protein n=1 Tax=Thaumasiovibrio subtropicus TaxID=1891207 RepID=UPI00192D0A28|nr:hypothetical protein [Thaumasiovibrio subtropicus]
MPEPHSDKARMDNARWLELMEACSLPTSQTCFDALLKAYSSPKRHYHNGEHIAAMLQHFDNVRALADDPNAIELAIWFHDAIYNPFSSTNELDSAVWSKTFLTENDASDVLIEHVYRLIMATQHNHTLHDNDEKLIVDIDLTILGAPRAVYDQFEKHVRLEYRFVPLFIYKQKRIEVLKQFLDQARIYNHDVFHQQFEASARQNLMRAITKLET